MKKEDPITKSYLDKIEKANKQPVITEACVVISKSDNPVHKVFSVEVEGGFNIFCNREDAELFVMAKRYGRLSYFKTKLPPLYP